MKNRIPTAFTDVIFVLVLCLTFLWFLAFLTPQLAEKKKPTAKPRTEFMISVFWDNETDSDVDIWANFEDKLICGYKRREVGHLILANDWTSNRYSRLGEETPKIAREVLNILRKENGMYTLSLYGFRIEQPTIATVIFEKVDPYEEIFRGEIELLPGSGELTFLRFHMDKDGKISEKNKNQELLGLYNFLK